MVVSACISGVASAVGTGLQNYDAPGVVSGTFFGVRANTVGQTFSRKFSAIDYKIQKQQLHREDIRDLVDLTTTRMDTFHVVGTLLLAFCMAWYTDNEILAGSLPTWFADIFLISNFASVGYLMLCVWLAMYAGVAARSIGVRLLTSYARLSFPTEEQLDDIKVPIFFNTREYLKKKMQDMSSSSQDASLADGEEVVLQGTPGSRPLEPKEELCEDDQQHFRKMLEEMPKWMVYDIWARVAMTMGINQMLQALSYYILGTLWDKSASIAIMSFMGINYLSYVMLWLDLGDNLNSFLDLVGVILLNLFPPGLAASLLACDSVLHHDGVDANERMRLVLSMLATVCFWAHGAWLGYLMLQFMDAGHMGTKYKPCAHAQVLEWVDFRPVQGDVLENLVRNTKALESTLGEAMAAEDERNHIDPSARTKLEPLHAAAWHSLRDLNEHRPWSHKFKRQPPQCTLAHAAKEYAGHVCTLYEVWAGAADMAMAFQALSHEVVQERLSVEQKEVLSRLRVVFVKHCTALEMGTCLADGGIKLTEPGQSILVHFEEDSQCPAEWIDTEGAGARVKKQTRGKHRVFEYPRVMEEMATWERLAQGLYTSKEALAPAKATIYSLPSPFDPEAGLRQLQEWNGGHEPGLWQKSVQAARPMEQADWLPRRVFNWFTIVTVVWWLLSGLFHALGVLYPHSGLASNFSTEPVEDGEIGGESLLQLYTPVPSRLFKMAALHCSGGQMWVSSPYALYRAPHALGAAPAGLEELAGHNGIGAILCRDGGSSYCHFLRHSSPNSTWTMALLAQARRLAGQELPLPTSWLVVSGAWDSTSCASPSSSTQACSKAFVAGWDGTSISAGALTWSAAKKGWAFLGRFDLDPSVGICGAHAGGSLARWTRGVLRGHGCTKGRLKELSDTYSDVKALQVGADGSTLTVLLGDGTVDVWDLLTGSVMQRLRTKAGYTSMCHSQEKLYLGRDGAAGPGLASLALPMRLMRTRGEPPGASSMTGGDSPAAAAPRQVVGDGKQRRRSSSSMLAAGEGGDP